MQFQYNSYIFLLIFSALLAIWVAISTWPQRQTRGALALIALALAVTEWTLSYALEIAGVDLATKIFWAKIEYVGIVLSTLLWLLFAFDYANLDQWLSRGRVALLSVVPAITVALALTNEAHHLIWTTTYINQAGNFSSLGVTHGAWFWVHSLYSYGLLLTGSFVILRLLRQRKGLYRGQIVSMILAVIFPWAGNILYLSGLSPFHYLDLTPFALTLSATVVAWGIFGFGLVEVSPMAHDLIVDEMIDGIIVVDLRERVVDINRAALELFHLSPAQVIGQQVEQVFQPWHYFLEIIRAEMNAGEEVGFGDAANLRWYEVRVLPFYDRRKRFTGRVVTVREVTEQRAAADGQRLFLADMSALQELHLILSEVDDLTQLYITMIDLAQRKLGIDRIGLFLLNEDGSQLMGTYGVDPDGNVRDESYYKEEIEAGHWTLEILNAPNRSKLWLDAPIFDNGEVVGRGWKAATTLWNGRQAIGYIVCDSFITGRPIRPYEVELLSVLGSIFGHLIENQRNEEALVIARDQAMSASRAKSTLLAKVSHELRTPLNGILGYGELLHYDAFGELSEKQKSATYQIIESTHFLTEMVNELLDAAQLDANMVVLKNEALSPAQLMESVEKKLTTLASQKNLELKTSISGSLPGRLMGDERRLQQVIFNLAGNALKFTKQGGVTIEMLRIDVGHWAIRVSDTGIGIPREARQYIFDSFRQVDNMVTRESRGTGLGLSITRQLVDLMKGEISLESEVGVGSVFTVLLPLAIPS
jgi:PAS domain S-box-containing protein